QALYCSVSTVRRLKAAFRANNRCKVVNRFPFLPTQRCRCGFGGSLEVTRDRRLLHSSFCSRELLRSRCGGECLRVGISHSLLMPMERDKVQRGKREYSQNTEGA